MTAYGLPNGLTHALTAKLEAALASWHRGRRNAAVNEIEAFIHQVDAKRDKALTDAPANTLIRAFEATEPDVVATFLALADGRVSEEALADWIRQRSSKRR